MNRMIYIAYGSYEQAKEKLTASSKPLDALLLTGFDLYLETSPRQWIRAVDLPKNHPANIMLSQSGFKAGLTDANGQTFTILNAFNEEHRKLAAQHGLYINVPYTPNKREELLKRLETIKAQLHEWSEIEQLKQQIETLQQKLRTLPSLLEEKQETWDAAVNQTLTVADLLEELVKASGVSTTQLEFQEAVKRAKKEAALESAIDESLLLNPDLIRSLKELAVS